MSTIRSNLEIDYEEYIRSKSRIEYIDNYHTTYRMPNGDNFIFWSNGSIKFQRFGHSIIPISKGELIKVIKEYDI